MTDKLKIAVMALKNILEPIKYLQDEAEKDGAKLDGYMAIQLIQNASIYQEIARKALEAIDTVVADVEKPTPTLEQSDDKRLLFFAYLQGKRDQIFWATKWEELTPIGKYRMMKQFLAWYQTLKLKEITK